MASRLERLFDLYSEDLARCDPSQKDYFQCPLCLRLFAKVPPLGDTVAEEHIVPEALGGRLTTLTCRQCNSEHGAKLDAHLIQRVLVEANKIPLSVRMKMLDASMGAEMDAVPDANAPISIRGIEKQSDERQVEKLKRLLKEQKTDITLHINYGYNERRSLVALLRSAYLQMFWLFGYRYILDPSAAVIRKQLDNPMERTNALNGIIWRISERLPHDVRVCVMHTPKLTQSFCILVRLDGDSHVAGVSLPPPGTDGTALYPLLLTPEAQGQKRCHPIPLDRGFLPFVETWRYFTEEDSKDQVPDERGGSPV